MTEVHSLILTMLIPLITFIGIGLTILVQYRIQKKTRHDQAMFYALDQCNKFVGAVHAYSDAIVQTGIASLGYANGYIDYANSTQYNLVPEHKEAIEKVLTTDLSNRAMVLERNHAIQAQQAYTYSTLASYLLWVMTRTEVFLYTF